MIQDGHRSNPFSIKMEGGTAGFGIHRAAMTGFESERMQRWDRLRKMSMLGRVGRKPVLEGWGFDNASWALIKL